MPFSPLWQHITRYFPESQYANADCIQIKECPADTPGFPHVVTVQGAIDCGYGLVDARAHGPWQILDACFDPALTPESPFTPEQWAGVYDPNVSTWMASVIYSTYGWRAWTSCSACGVCEVRGLPIPHPRGPVFPGGGGLSLPLVLATGGAIVALFLASKRRR